MSENEINDQDDAQSKHLGIIAIWAPLFDASKMLEGVNDDFHVALKSKIDRALKPLDEHMHGRASILYGETLH